MTLAKMVEAVSNAVAAKKRSDLQFLLLLAETYRGDRGGRRRTVTTRPTRVPCFFRSGDEEQRAHRVLHTWSHWAIATPLSHTFGQCMLPPS